MTGVMTGARDHGGGLDAAITAYGGARSDWVDLSTGINPVPYPVGSMADDVWTALPDRGAFAQLEKAAREFWRVPDAAAVIAAPGASALIARLPALRAAGTVAIEGPTYNEHAAAFRAHGWQVSEDVRGAAARVQVHPNNPDGRAGDAAPRGGVLDVIDESFCDVTPAASVIARTGQPGTIVLKSFGKFWGLAGLRLGFAIGHPDSLRGPGGAELSELIGPWAVSGPALAVGARALGDEVWADETRARLARDADRLDGLVTGRSGATLVGGTDLFRLYDVGDAAQWQDHLARHRIWSRIFPYSTRWLRLGLPHPTRWDQVADGLAGL